MKYPLRILACFLLLAFFLRNEAAKTSNPEYLEWNSLKINNQLPLLCKKSALIKLLGNADSIKTPLYEDICASHFDSAFQYIYFGESVFETADSLAVVSIIDFETSNIKLVSSKISLDITLTLEKLKQIFPMAVKDASLEDVEKKGKLLSIKIATSKNDSDDAFVLLFRNGKLVRIDYWIQC